MSALALRVMATRAAGAAALARAGAGGLAGSSRTAPRIPQRAALPQTWPRAAATTAAPSASAFTPSSTPPPPPPPAWPSPATTIAMLYDGDCPLCMREVNMLRARDEGAGKIWFVDVAGPDFEAGPGAAFGISYETAMATIHAVRRDGRVLSGVEVFRALYEAVGLGWVYGFLRVPALKAATEAVYRLWAAARLPLTGRPTLEAVLAERKTCRKE